ncbi:Endonuclease/exonuclease/phosphatase [Martensiomyces pterosporus]|nr:Endonuclease/exonuclease/phosphatase [Martensiomyces pterosporus]
MAIVPEACKGRSWLPVDGGKAAAKKGHSFTVMSYNILCQKLVRRTLFPYASKASLRWKSRKDKLVNELTYLKPDIACLQEMCTEHWHQIFYPQFSRNSYESRFFQSLHKSHGVTISWKKSKFHIVDELGVEMDRSVEVCGDALETDNVALIVVLQLGPEPRAGSADPYADSVDPDYSLDQGGPGRDDSAGQGIIVSTTHLFWRPDACFERLQQQIVLLRALKKMQAKYPGYPVIACGDYNTTPDDAGYDLATKPRPVTLNEWQLDNLLPRANDASEDEDDDEEGSDKEADGSKAKGSDGSGGVPVSYADVVASGESAELPEVRAKRLKFLEEERLAEKQLQEDTERVGRLVKLMQAAFPPLRSSYGTYADIDASYRTDQWQGEPIYTNYAKWKGTLDYIFYTPATPYLHADPSAKACGDGGPTSLEAREVLSLPPESRMKPGLPNETFASDHVSLMARFELEAI